MKKFKDLSIEQLKRIIETSDELRNEFDMYIQESEMDYMQDKLEKVERSLSDWCIDFYGQNFMSVKNYSVFIDCLEDYDKCFGLSFDVLTLLDLCKRLEGYNLFNHYAQKLSEKFFEEEFKNIVNDVERMSYNLHCRQIDVYAREFIEGFVMSREEYLYDEETETYYIPKKCAV